MGYPSRSYATPNFSRIPRRITRALVQSCLEDADNSDDECHKWAHYKGRSSSAERNMQLEIAEEHLPDSLQETRRWLIELADKEQSAIDWNSDYPRISLDLSSSGSDASRRALNAQMLKWISMGLGPRPGKRLEDLMDTFRTHTPTIDHESMLKSSTYESYGDLLQMIQSWNSAIAYEQYGSGDDQEHIKEFLNALEERNRTLIRIGNGMRSPIDLDRRVVRAIHKFRPETISFTRSDPYQLLATMTANHLIAKPDLKGADTGLWDAMFKAMLIEVRLHADEKDTVMKLSLNAKLELAKENDEKDEVERLSKEKQDLNEHMFAKAATVVIDDLKRARKELMKKTLEELQLLTVVQAGQKMTLGKVLVQEPSELLEDNCREADAELNRVLRDRVDELLAGQELAQGIVDVSLELSKRGLRRVRRFAALEVPKDRRNQTIKERMDNPLTVNMMMSVVEENQLIWDTSKAVLRRVTEMESSLQQVWEAAKRQLQTYEEVYSRVSGE